MKPNLSTLTLTAALDAIRKKEFTPLELVGACVEQIGRLNPEINAFITICSPGKLQDVGHLAGIPIAIKDLIETAGVLTTAGSKHFRKNVPLSDAFVVHRLKVEGGVIVGKTNLHEIALGVTNINPHFGTCRNPWDPKRISGGSSGGSAAAVATGMCLGALGTDTGGSIRIPASMCGVVGLKPTYGRVSLQGVIPLSWNLDHVGPMGRCVRDVSLLLKYIAGYDPLDPVSEDIPLDGSLARLQEGVKGWRVALASGEYFEDADEEVRACVREAARIFIDLGSAVRESDLTFLREAAQANTKMTQADAAAYHQQRLVEHADWFGEDVLQRLRTGAALSATDYSLARRTQSEMRLRMEQFFADYDILLTPTIPFPAPTIEGTDALEKARQLTRFTSPFNLTGLPALSVPCGFTHQGLPVGLQIVSRPWMEGKVLRAGQAFEQALKSTRIPAMLG
jgi:aspartyl-tRNA(Asn)/glutamyl-tRNA(Gln) amidotransferase subunit A